MSNVSAFRTFDRELHAAEAHLTAGLSPETLFGAYMDWAGHLINQPGRRTALLLDFLQDMTILTQQAMGVTTANALQPNPGDRRFNHSGWISYPFSLFEQAFLRAERWWSVATTGIQGVSRSHERMVSFTARQLLDMMAPSNIPFLNPEVLETTWQSEGRNLLQGFSKFVEDMTKQTQELQAKLPLRPGRDVAVTPGQVVLRNGLIELIQYSSLTDKVHPEPVLIVPAWIMKYYILDLQPHDSLIRFLVEQGYTVFCISWLNPSRKQREVHLDDYRKQGVMTAIDAIAAITKARKIHAAGYCLGGTLLSITAAAMAREHDERLASLTLLAAQTDFTEAGELQLFINEAQLAFLDDLMWKSGYLDASQMAGAFQMLRSADLIWSRMVRRYYLGVEDEPNDLTSWNMDATRMPYRMHSEYLWHMFQNNNLAMGRFPADGKPVSLSDIDLPLFVVGTERDHIAPWRSVHKLHLLNPGSLTFVLASGGHNSGIVSEPGHANRSYKILERKKGAKYRGPDEWQRVAKPKEGSWWPEWTRWLGARSSAPKAPPHIGDEKAGYPPLCAAPGTYVMRR